MMLLLPNKNANPDMTTLSVSALVLGRLKKNKFESYSDLYERVREYEPRALSLFDKSLQLLYVLGLIEYHQKNDLLEYVGK